MFGAIAGGIASVLVGGAISTFITGGHNPASGGVLDGLAVSAHQTVRMFGATAGGIASALAGGAMSKLCEGGQKAASAGRQEDLRATDNNTVGMVDSGIKSAIQGSNVFFF